MNEYDERGFQLAIKHDQALGLCHCLYELCKDFDYSILNGLRYSLEETLDNLNEVAESMNELGEERPITQIDMFRAYKLFHSADSRINECWGEIKLFEFQQSAMFKHIYNATYALLNLLLELVEQTNDSLENPPAPQAA